SSCSDRTSGATRVGTHACASSPRPSACTPSRRVTCTRTTRPAPSCKTCSSRSAAAAHSTRASASAAATTNRSCCPRRTPQSALEVRGPSLARNVLPPGRGRGSSVGSLVCYLTGLSHVDPVAADLSLGRFLNRDMAGVPDIDLDFPRDIREKLIVRVTEQYGREHAALVASFAAYRWS